MPNQSLLIAVVSVQLKSTFALHALHCRFDVSCPCLYIASESRALAKVDTVYLHGRFEHSLCSSR